MAWYWPTIRTYFLNIVNFQHTRFLHEGLRSFSVCFDSHLMLEIWVRLNAPVVIVNAIAVNGGR